MTYVSPPKPLPSWWMDACLFRFGLISPRPKDVPHLTKPQYQWCFDEWEQYLLWQKWWEGGKHGQRPKVWNPVPSWVWELESKWLKHHPVNPPPPVPKEKVSKWTNPPWRGIGVHTTWAFSSGTNTGNYTPQSLADKIAATKIQWAVLEGSPAQNESYMLQYRDALKSHGKRFGIWERCDAQKNYPESYIDHAKRIVNTYQPDFYGADVEQFPIEEPSFPIEFAKAFPDLPRIAIIPGLPDASFLQDWWDNDWDLMAQDYAANIGQPPVPGIAGTVDHDAFWRNCPRNFIPTPQGWGTEWWQHGSGPHSVPIIEVNAEGNGPLSTQYPDCDAVKWFGGNWSIWNVEELTDSDWSLLT